MSLISQFKTATSETGVRGPNLETRDPVSETRSTISEIHMPTSDPDLGEYYKPILSFKTSQISLGKCNSKATLNQNQNSNIKSQCTPCGASTKARSVCPKSTKNVLPPLPEPINLGLGDKVKWDYEDNLSRDCDNVDLHEQESIRAGEYQLNGFKNIPMDANSLDAVAHFVKVNTNSEFIDQDTQLTHSGLSRFRGTHQLRTRPYAGFYAGPGNSGINNKDVETALQQGILTNLRDRACNLQGTSFYRYQCLPEFGNPQRVEHVIPAPPEVGGWIRGGDATRDFVRRVDYQKRCFNKVNGRYVNKIPLYH